MRWRGGFAVVGLLCTTMCGCTDEGEEGLHIPVSCIPGGNYACMCEDGTVGSRVCNDDGAGYGECGCGGRASGDARGSHDGGFPVDGPAIDAGDTCAPQCDPGKECGDDGSCGSCGDCGEGESCDEATGQCVAACIPDCAGKECGPDGCGSECGACPLHFPFCKGGHCEDDCQSSCEGKECGSDGCGGSCGVCPADAPVCDATTGKCLDTCKPACAGKQCGPDGCDGACGVCPADLPLCDGAGQCQASCVPSCGTPFSPKECGADGCGGSCGTCPAGTVCDAATGKCAGCAPMCADSAGQPTCGPDGCGGKCTCPATMVCDLTTAACVTPCQPDCAGKQCGPNGCGGSCGTCLPGTACDETSGKCGGACLPECAGKACGPDGCGGSCGSCGFGQKCDEAAGKCIAICTPQCQAGGVTKQCGPDGCGGSCGACPAGEICNTAAGTCSVLCTPACAGKECGPDGCGGSCGTCTGALCGADGNCASKKCVDCGFEPACYSFSFESGDFSGFSTSGSAAVLGGLGESKPTDGSFMAMMGTELSGYAAGDGTIVLGNCLPAGSYSVSFDWQFLSEEFKEYCGSGGQDGFRIYLVVGGKSTVLLQRTHNQLCGPTDSPSCAMGGGCGQHFVGLDPASPGLSTTDVYKTPWVAAKVNATLPAGPFQLVAEVFDSGGSSYDSILLLDDIVFAPCTPSCGGKTCGPDGCGGTCGSCLGLGECMTGTCTEAGTCAASPPGSPCTDDGIPCTADGCDGTGKCVHSTIPGAVCCVSDAECDDADVCTKDSCAGGLCVHVPSGAAGCCDPVVFSDSFDGGSALGWSITGNKENCKWQVTTTGRSVSPPGAMYYGNPGAWNYNCGTSSGFAVSPAITLPDADGLTLSFEMYVDVEDDPNYDLIGIRVLDGDQTTLLFQKGDLLPKKKWNHHEKSLAPWKGKTIQIRFGFATQDGKKNDTEGLYFDDVTVTKSCD